MKLTFGKIEIHNFLCYVDETFDFSAYKGMNLICGKNNDISSGKNGAGKSALFSALIFALFGQTVNKIKADNVSNRFTPNSEETKVKIYFKAAKTDWSVESGYHAKYKNSYCEVKKLNPETQKWENMTKSSQAETRAYIEKEVLRCDMSIFLRTILLSSDQTYNFFKLKAKEKRDFIEHLFDISIFALMFDSIHRDILESEKQEFALESSLMNLTKAKEQYESADKNYKEEKEKEKAELEAKASELKSKIEALKKAWESGHGAKEAEVAEKLKLVSSLFSKLDSASDSLSDRMTALSNEKFRLSTVKSSKSAIVSSHKFMLDKLCDKCKAVFDGFYKVNEAISEISETDKKIESVTHSLESVTSEIEALQQKRAVLLSKKSALEKMADEAEKAKLDYEYSFKTLESAEDSAELQLLNFQKSIDENPYHKLLEQNSSDIAEVNSKLASIGDSLNYLKYAENLVSQDTLKKFIIKDLVVLLNTKIRFYLNKLGASFTCIFDENMDYEFMTESGSAEYDNFSSGEKMRLTIATSLAFRDFMATRSNITSNILILDEYIDSNIDKLAIDGIIEILKEFVVLYNQNIYIVSHRKEIDNSIFNNIIIIEKTHGISKITYENH